MLPLAVVLMVAVAGGVWWFMNSRIPGTTAQVSPVPAPTGKPSIAVLPFDNMSGDTEQSYFADGITEDLITDLSKAGALFVITRNSTFAQKGRSRDIREVGKALGVRYVLEAACGRAARTSASMRSSSTP